MGTTLAELLVAPPAQSMVFRDGIDTGIRIVYTSEDVMMIGPLGPQPHDPDLPEFLTFTGNTVRDPSGNVWERGENEGIQVLLLFDPRIYVGILIGGGDIYVPESGKCEIEAKYSVRKMTESLALLPSQSEWISQMMGVEDREVIFRFENLNLREMEQRDLPPFEQTTVTLRFLT